MDESMSSHVNERPKTAPGSMLCPVVIDVNPFVESEFYESIEVEMSNQEVTTKKKKKKKPGFWKLLFGEQQCPCCNENYCDCKRRIKTKKKLKKETNYYIDMSDKKKPSTNCSPVIQTCQTNENCPTKCTLPINQRGVGCHLYFCIDSKPKKQIKTRKNDKNTRIREQAKDCSVVKDLGVPQVTVVCDSSKDTIDKTIDGLGISQSKDTLNSLQSKDRHNYSKSKNTLNFSKSKDILNCSKSKDTLNHSKSKDRLSRLKSKERPNFSQSREILPKVPQTTVLVQSSNSRELTDHSFKQENIYDNHSLQKVNIEDKITANPPSPAKIQGNEENIVKKNDIEVKEKITTQVGEPTTGNKKYSRTSILRNNHESINFPAKVHTSSPHDNFYEDNNKVRRYNLSNKKLESVLSSESEENFERGKKLSKRSTAKGSFVRNSLVTLRKEKRNSLLEGRVSLILKKLTDIENKIEVIEKSKEDEGEKGKLGTSACNNAKSTIFVKFEDEKGKEKKDQITSVMIQPSKQNLRDKSNRNKATSVVIKTSNQDLKDTIKIKNKNNNILIQTPGNVNIVKQDQSKLAQISESKQVLHHNCYEMDAHVIGTNRNLTNRSMKCHNPRIVVSYPMKDQNSDTWRRVSEELKISQGHLTNQENCACTKYIPV